MRVQKMMTQVWLIPTLIGCMVFCTACGRNEVGIEGSETQDMAQATSAEATDDVGLTPTQSILDVDLVTPQTPVHKASGLVLGSQSETFYVDVAGQVVTLVDQPHAQLNSTHDQVLFAREEPSSGMSDIWLLDKVSGEERNLTQTPDRDEIFPQWWPAHPEIVFFVSGKEIGMTNPQWPTIVGLDGTGYRVIDENQGGSFSLSPDGALIAYGGSFIYHWDGDREVFEPKDYGLNVEKTFQPSFSPDGRYLAWKVAGDLNADGGYANGLAVFDLKERTAKLMHVYTVQGGGMIPHYIAWSPDGAWIAYVTFGEGPAVGREPNLWVLRPDGSQEMFIDIGLEPTWSPDGQSLAYIHATMEGERGLRIADVESWNFTPIDDLPFPDTADFIMDWIQP
jgi:Tol biopolymer transport system component